MGQGALVTSADAPTSVFTGHWDTWRCQEGPGCRMEVMGRDFRVSHPGPASASLPLFPGPQAGSRLHRSLHARCPLTGPETTESGDRAPKPLNPGAEINLFSFEGIFLGIFSQQQKAD